jgi:hypothetical protein
MSGQFEKAQRFRTLHEALETFVVANAWDAGSAWSGHRSKMLWAIRHGRFMMHCRE